MRTGSGSERRAAGGLVGSRRAGVHGGEGVARTPGGTLRRMGAWPGGSCQVMAVQLPSSGLRNATVGLGGLVGRVPAEWNLGREPCGHHVGPS